MTDDPAGWLYIRPDRDRPWQVGDQFTAYPLGPPQPADESPIAKFTIPHEPTPDDTGNG